jgi:hypothetical protein
VILFTDPARDDTEWFSHMLNEALASTLRKAEIRGLRPPYRITLTNGDGTLLADVLHEEKRRNCDMELAEWGEMFYGLRRKIINQMFDTVETLERMPETPLTLELTDGRWRVKTTIEEKSVPHEQLQ